MSHMQFFEDGKLEPIKAAILKVNEANKFMNQIQLNCLETIIRVVEDKKTYTSSKLYKNDLELLDSLIRWDPSNLVGPLGLFHLYLNHPQASELFKVMERGTELVYLFIQILNHSQSSQNVILLALRCVANMFRYTTGEAVLRERGQKVIETVNQFANHEKLNIRSVVSIIYLNYSISYIPIQDELS